MKVCVTGAAGFIGRHVCNTLADAGHAITKLDIVYGDDITQPLPRIEGLDAVIHLAALANPRVNEGDPAQAFNVNVNGTHQVLKMALESGAKKMVFASSAHVYGISAKYLPTDEKHPLWFQNNYGVTQVYTLTKILGERLCELYYENFSLSYTTLRLFNTYGPGQMPGYFIPDMLAKAQGGHIALSDGNTTKDWVYVEDVARAFLLALTTPFVGAVNVGTGVETKLSSIAATICQATGASYGFTDSPKATRMQADIGRAKRILGWEPKVTLEEGLDTIFNRTTINA